jgi:hypothetical protein
MRERGRYQIQLMKTRSSSGVGMKIDLDFNVDTLRISDLDEQDSYGNNNTPSAGSSLLNSIKQRQTVNPSTGEISPVDGVAIPKIKGAQVESTKLRELLNNLPGDDLV